MLGSRKGYVVMRAREAFDSVVMALHEAAFDDALWPRTSLLIDEACGAAGNELVVGDDFGSNVRIFCAWFYRRGERRVDLEQTYFETYHPRDERLPRLRQLPDGKLVHVSELYAKEELKVSAAYNEGLRLSGAQNGLNVRFDGPNGTRIVWAIADSIRPEGWGSDQIAVIERLLPHLRQHAWTRQVVGDAHYLGSSLAALLENTRVGVIHLDRRGRIIEAKPKGAKGFTVLSRRWVVERTFAWMGRCRCLAKDVERTLASSLAWVKLAGCRFMMRRVARHQNLRHSADIAA